MGIFERYLSIWVALCVSAVFFLNSHSPAFFSAIAGLEIDHTNLVAALFIWVMTYPVMMQIDFSSIKSTGKKSKGWLLW